MASIRVLLSVVLGFAPALFAQALEQQSAARNAENPIRKAVTLLQDMQKKVEEEGKREKELYDKFMCYCTTGEGDLDKSITDAEAKLGSLAASIEASKASLDEAEVTLSQARADLKSAKDTVAEATALRNKEAAAFAQADAEYATNIAALTKAVAAVEKGVSGGFLQTPGAQVLRRLTADAASNLAELDRQTLVAFLDQTAGYVPQSGEVTGILKQLTDEFSATLADLRATEAAAIKNYDALVAAKTKEEDALQATIETKSTQIGELRVSLAQMDADSGDTADALAEDKKYLAELATSCATKTAEWEARSKTRSEELVALADTIKVLSDDDALELFKKTLPSAGASSLLQTQVSASSMRSRALSALRATRRTARPEARPALDMILLMLTDGQHSGTGGQFDAVLKLIDDLVASLKKEQGDDDAKKEYCATQFDVSDDKKKALERTISDEEKAIAATEEGIKTLTEEIATLEAGIKALDKAVAEATDLRKSENAEYKDLIASDTAAKEVILFAKNRLNKFYNPKLYKAAPKVELSTEDRMFKGLGGTVTTKAPGGIAGTGVTVLVEVTAHVHKHASAEQKDAPAPPPATWGAYQTKSSNGNGVIALLDLLVADLDKELAQGETAEKEAQKDYEQLMADSGDKRAADSKSLTEKQSAKATLEGELQAHKEGKAAAEAEHLATLEYIHSLHGECDWLLKFFDTRKEARADEVDSLGKAKAVLSGADYALLQTASRGFLTKRTA